MHYWMNGDRGEYQMRDETYDLIVDLVIKAYLTILISVIVYIV